MQDWVGEINTWLYGIASASIGAIFVLVRKINTNEKQIELLKKEIATREEFRKERDEEIKGQLAELRSDVKALMQTFK
jgi:uncharacterized membrane protein (DUF106 family)